MLSQNLHKQGTLKSLLTGTFAHFNFLLIVANLLFIRMIFQYPGFLERIL